MNILPGTNFHNLWPFLIIGLILTGVLIKNPPQTNKYTDLTSEQLFMALANKDFFLVNVHIPYAGEIETTDAFIPYNEIKDNLGKLPQDKNAKIVLYCQSGRMSAIAARTLSDLGFTNIYNLFLGMHDWQSKGYPLKTNKILMKF